jgi:pSer/pThr/pTyr-binding forkhead associated (FHA) protein
MSRLVLLSEGFTGRTCDLKVDKVTIGRVEDNTFQIADGSISSHHCEILLQGSDVLIRDLDSTNGSFINGERITEAVLKPGQILRLGMIEMRLESGDAAPSGKKKLDHTIVIPQGVKVDELEGTRPLVFEGKTGFEKKNNKATVIFVIGVIIIGIILVGLLLFVVVRGVG